VESPSLYQLSDEHLLIVNVVPKPFMLRAQAMSYVTTLSVANPYQDRTSAQTYTVHYKVALDPRFNSDYLENFKHIYLAQVICRVGSSLLWIQANVTWASHNVLQCTTVSFYDHQPECIEVSINNGRTFTSDHQSLLSSKRAPVAFDYGPKVTMLRTPLSVTIQGRYFNVNEIYKCLFHKT